MNRATRMFLFIFCLPLLCGCCEENAASDTTSTSSIMLDELALGMDDKVSRDNYFSFTNTGIVKPSFGDFLTFVNWYCYDGLILTDEQVHSQNDHPEIVQDVEYTLTKDLEDGRVLSMSASYVIYADRNAAYNDDYSAAGWSAPRTGGGYETYTCGYTENNDYQYYELEYEFGYVLSYLLDEVRITIGADPELKEDARAIMAALLTGDNYMTLSAFDEYLRMIDNSDLIQAAVYDKLEVNLELTEYVSINKWHKVCLTDQTRGNKMVIDYITILDNYHIMYEQEELEPIKYPYSNVHALAEDSLWDFLYLNGYEFGFSEQTHRCSQVGRNYTYSTWDDTEQGGLYRVRCMVDEVMIIITADAEMKWQARDLMTQLLRRRH